MFRRDGSRPRGRRLAALVLAGGLLPLSASAVAADEPAVYVLDVFSCTVSDSEGNPVDNDAIPAGSEVWVFEGWIANTRGQLQGFLNNVTWVLEINGQSVDVRPYLSGLLNFGPFWGDLFSINTGTLESGETLTTLYDNVLKAASYDGVVHWDRGSTYGGGVECSVSAA